MRLNRRSLRGWHIRLLDQLGQRPDRRIRIAWTEDAGGLPPNAELLFRLEAAIHGLPRPGLATAAEPVALVGVGAGQVDHEVGGRVAQDADARGIVRPAMQFHRHPAARRKTRGEPAPLLEVGRIAGQPQREQAVERADGDDDAEGWQR